MQKIKSVLPKARSAWAGAASALGAGAIALVPGPGEATDCSPHFYELRLELHSVEVNGENLPLPSPRPTARLEHGDILECEGLPPW